MKGFNIKLILLFILIYVFDILNVLMSDHIKCFGEYISIYIEFGEYIEDYVPIC